MRKVVILSFFFVSLMFMTTQVQAQQHGDDGVRAGHLRVGSHLGLHAGTPDGTAFALVFNGDYFLDDRISLGPLFQFGISGDLFQLGISMQAKYEFMSARYPGVRTHLQGGLGFINIDSDKPGSNDDDMGFLVPFGGGIDFALSRNLSFGSTLLLNFTDANVNGRRGNTFMTWVFGLRLAL